MVLFLVNHVGVYIWRRYIFFDCLVICGMSVSICIICAKMLMVPFFDSCIWGDVLCVFKLVLVLWVWW